MSSTTLNEPFRDREAVLPPPGAHVHRRVSWRAILGGVVLVVSVQLLWSLLGAGIGLDTIDVGAGTTPTAGSLGIGAGVWWLVSSVVALGFGGYAAAWLAGSELRRDGVLHGLVTWGVASLLAVYLLTSAAGSLIGGTASVLGGLASTAGSGLKAAAQPVAQATGLTPDMLQQQAQAFLKPANPDPATMSPQDAMKEVTSDLATYAKGGPDADAARARIVAIMAAQQHISPDQASRQFDEAQARLKQEKAQAVQAAKQAADAAATAAAHTAFAAFTALLVGAIASAIGGGLAARRRVPPMRRAAR